MLLSDQAQSCSPPATILKFLIQAITLLRLREDNSELRAGFMLEYSHHISSDISILKFFAAVALRCF